MKKNEFATFIVYIGMMAIAILVGLFVIRPLIGEEWTSSYKVLLSLAFLAIAVVLNSLLIELGHLLGAKAGHYDVSQWTVLGLSIKTDKNGKKKFAFSNFDGLTGETKLVPKDINKSTMSGVITIPLLFFLVEVILSIIFIAISEKNAALNGNSRLWLKVLCTISLTIGGMIYLYNYFPAYLDSMTDGYKMVLLNKPINKVAYNQILLNQRRMELGQPVIDIPPYTEITDFTAQVNLDKVYLELSKGEVKPAVAILDAMMNSEDKISNTAKNNIATMKLSLFLLTNKKDAGKEYYEENVEDDVRKYIMMFNDSPSLRCYLMICGVLEGSVTETNFALAKVDKLIKRTPEGRRAVEQKLTNLTITRIKTLHPSWELIETSCTPKKEKEEPVAK